MAGLLMAVSQSGLAQIVQFTAVLSSAQEVPAVTSPATGTAVLLYDVAANNFDLVVTVSSFANTLTATRIQEGASGVVGPFVNNLGDEALYTRNGNTLTAIFRGIAYGCERVPKTGSGGMLVRSVG